MSKKNKSTKTTKNEDTAKILKSSKSSKSSKTSKTSKSIKTSKTSKTTITSTLKIKKTKKKPKIRTSKLGIRKRNKLKAISGTKKLNLEGIGGISNSVRNLVNTSNKLKNIRFYDDSIDNINDVSKDIRIECILIPRETKTVPKGKSDGGKINEYIRWIRDHGGWDIDDKDSDLYDVLRFFYENEEYQEDETSDALTENYMNDLLQWARINPDAKCVLFDFDRVINQVEGIIGYDYVRDIRKYDLKPSGFAKYHMGTKKRYKLFKKLINELIRRNIDIHIVTNNTAANCELFHEILKKIHPVFNKNTIHGSYKHDTKLHCIREFL